MVINMVSIGCVIKNPGNTRNNKTGSWRTFKPVLDKEKCIDCENCIIFCPDSSVNKQHDIDYDFCKGCGICAHECPSDAIEMIKE